MPAPARISDRSADSGGRVRIKHWIRRTLRRYGINPRFTDVVCPQHVKVIRVGADGRTEVEIERTLVFLDVPEPGDLLDAVPADTEGDAMRYRSPDARELLRTTGRNHTFVHWTPNEPIVPYALYVHRYGWTTSVSEGETALYTEFRCDTRTGVVDHEIGTAARFEAAVAFKRPRWRPMTTQASLVKYALERLESDTEKPSITDNGKRLEWRIVSPRMGERYVCVAFHQNGIALWQNRLDASSIVSRMRRLIRPLLPI
jgi:hypothetical protein